MTTLAHTPADRLRDQSADPDEPLLFDAVLRPNRSLSARGFLILMFALGGCSFVAGMAFVIAGAWPVIGFLGFDVLAVYIAFRLNYRAGRACEIVRLTERKLALRRVDWRGRMTQQEFQPYWLRVELDEPEAGGGCIWLASHGRRSPIGAFLSPDERAEFAEALRAALRDLRHMRY